MRLSNDNLSKPENDTKKGVETSKIIKLFNKQINNKICKFCLLVTSFPIKEDSEFSIEDHFKELVIESNSHGKNLCNPKKDAEHA